MRVMLSCGEPSGDVYAGALVRALREREPGIEVFGLGGRHFKAAGGRLIGDFSGLSVTGFSGPLRVLPRSIGMLRRLMSAAAELKPDVFVAIDFSGFNFRLVTRLKRLGVPIVYYVSPQLWAWRSGRMKTMQRYVDHVLVIFPFEEAIYRKAGVPVTFVGHPLVDTTRSGQPRSAFLRDRGLVPEAPTVALLPGSRTDELRYIAPTMAAAVPLIRARVPDVQFVVACAPSVPDHLFAPLLAESSAGPSRRPVLVHDRTDDVLASSDVVITASGTATVQCALHERPMVVVYRLAPLEYRLGKRFIKIDTYAMPNLIAGARVVPELIQDEFTPQRVADETVALLIDHERQGRTREALRRVREQLGQPGASGRAADAVLTIARAGIAARI